MKKKPAANGGGMMPYIWTEPLLVLKHLGVSVCNVYKDGYWDRGQYDFQYTTDATEEAEPFDIRDLDCFRDGDSHADILRRAIEGGELADP
jgi:hypothetical protein